MSTPTTAAGWAYVNTAATQTIVPNRNWLFQNSTGTISSYYQNDYRLEQPSAAEMISRLELGGHVVLQKKQHALNRGLPTWDERFDPVTKAVDHIHYGYALPEKEGDYLMPDGSTLKVDQYGNYQVLDQDAKVTYKANRIREFNPYINASDLLEKFIGYVGNLALDVKQTEILQLPIEAFVNWLILQAATRDGDSLDGLPSVEKALPAPIPKKPRCLSCGRFMSKMWAATTRIAFCSQAHWAKHQRRLTHVRDGATSLRPA